MKEYKCPKCNSKNLFVKKVGNNTGLYCVDCGAWIKQVGKNELRAFEYLTKQKHVDDANSKQDDIANIIYGTLDHMYCDNCRFNSEIKESDNGEWNCDECHRKYNGWGVSMQESNKIAKEILKQLGEQNMSRLIDADKIDFNEVFVGASEFAQDTRNAAQMLIDNQPTAFDADKAISELERDKFIESECILSDVHQGYNAGLSRAIEIVKGGGVE